MKGRNNVKKPLKVFLSGPVTSRLDTYQAEFEEAARIVREAGHLPLNPAALPIGMERRDYMRITLAMLDSADLILQLPGWGKSAGAVAEYAVAMKTGVESLSLDDFIRVHLPERPKADQEPQSEPKRLSRVERLFGKRESWTNVAVSEAPAQDTTTEAPSQPTVRTTEEEPTDQEPGVDFQQRAVRGFLIVECVGCGQTRVFCSRAEITSSRCKRCGHITPLNRTYTRPAYARCKCGREFKYQTNATTDTLTISCINCGSPIDMRLNARGTAYVTPT